jgi:hypothetical protein
MRIVAAVILFWVIEDALWFVLNPAFGVAKLTPAHVPWHKHWWGPLPVDYWVSGAIGLVLLFASYRGQRGAEAPA